MKRDLSPRQREIMRLVVRGFEDKEIAFQLNIRRGTIRSHMEQIFLRLNVKNRAHAAAIFVR